ncbi:MAG: S8 family serine peptidase [Myxococcota bacterium]
MTEIKIKLRGKDIGYEKIDSLVALRSGDASAIGRSHVTATTGKGLLNTADLDTLSSANVQTAGQWGTFQRAGWAFAEPKNEHVAEAARCAARLDGQAVRQVLLDEEGHTAIDTGLATVQLPGDMTLQQVQATLSSHKLHITQRLGVGSNVYEVRLPESMPTLEHVAELQEARDFTFAEPALMSRLGGRFRPADLGYRNQWHHHNDGSSGGLPGADIDAEAAWDITRGKSGDGRVRVAVIDNGMDVGHPDLVDALTGGGFFTDEHDGSRFVRREAGIEFPDANHGTFCLGMAGARANGKGGVGGAPEAALIPVACLSDQVGSQTTLALALVYAALPRVIDPTFTEPGADIVTCSLGPNGGVWRSTSVLDLAIRRVTSEGRNGIGTAIFWATSNGYFDIALDEVSSDSRVIAVGRSNHLDLADGSAYGDELDLLAPGARVYSTKSGGSYGIKTGTSFACPLAAGVGALVLSKTPGLTPLELRRRLCDTCDKIGPGPYDNDGRNAEYGHGRINAHRALAYR